MSKHKPPPDGSDLDVLGEWAVEHALLVVGAVHDEGHDATTALLAGLDHHQARALVVALAAMVDPERPVSYLLAWVDWTPQATAHRARLAAATGEGVAA